MTWHKKAAGTSPAKPPAKPKTPTVAKPKAPTVAKPAATSVAKPAPGAVKPVTAAKDAKMAKTGKYAAKAPHFGPKHGPVNKGHIK
jgi:hypothetical protein